MLDKIHLHYKDNLTQEQVVNHGISCSEELTNAYNMLQAFYDALAIKHPQAIKKSLMPMKKLAGKCIKPC